MRRTIALLATLTACGIVALSPLRAAGAEPAKQLTADQVKALIVKLGDADFKVREAAQKDLAAAGPSALGALEQATESDDAEVKQRATEAIKQIKNAIALAVSQDVAKNYLWSYPVGNGIIGSPVVYGGAAYVTGQDLTIHAVDAKTGKEAWTFALPVKGMPQVSAGEKVVALTVGTTLTVVGAKDGNQLWHKDVRPAPAAAPAGGAGAAVAPVPVAPGQGGNVAPNARPGAIMAAGGFVAMGRPQAWVVGDVVVARVAADKLKAFKALSGEDAWEMEVKPAWSPISPAVVADGIAYLVEAQSVSAIDLASQKRLWTQELANCTSLVFGAQTLACTAGGKIVALDAKKGEKLWEADMAGAGAGNAAGPNMMPSGIRAGTLVLDDRRVYAVLGDEMVTFDLKKGDKATAKLDLSVPQAEPGKEAGADPTVPAANGLVVVGQAGAGGGMILSTSGVRGGMARWTAANGTIYVGGNGGLFAFDGATGQRLWALPIKQMMQADPVVVEGVIYYGTSRSGSVTTDDKTPDKDLPGLHALGLKAGAPASAPAKADAAPAGGPVKRIGGPMPPVSAQ
jgi:outer membrane protein assembly factor BamB